MSLDLTLYRTFIEGCERRASAAISSMVHQYMVKHPDASPEEVQAFTLESMELQLGIYGDAAATRALEMFDEVCEREGIDATSRHFDVVDRSKVEDAVHYARTLHLDKMGKDEAGYLKRCRLLMGSYVHRSAWDNVIRNCERNHVRWARVPTGLETCGWCLMLASRGFDYLSSDTARAGNHNGCDCMVVPGRKGTEIDGYDPGAMRASFHQMARELDVDVNDPAERTHSLSLMSDYMRLKDPEWVYQGKVPKVRYVSEALRKKILRDQPHEAVTASRFARLGFSAILGVDSEEDGMKNGTKCYRGLADLTSGLELKSLISADGINAVDKHLRSTGHKKGVIAAGIDNGWGRLDDREVLEKLPHLARRRGVSRVLYLDSRGRLHIVDAEQ